MATIEQLLDGRKLPEQLDAFDVDRWLLAQGLPPGPTYLSIPRGLRSAPVDYLRDRDAGVYWRSDVLRDRLYRD